MTTSPFQLPLPAEFEVALQKLDVVWGLVPRSARPLHKQHKEDLDRVFERCVRYAETRATQIAAASAIQQGGGADGAPVDLFALPDEPTLAFVMRVMRTLTPEQFLQVKILMMMRDLSDESRFEVFEEIGDSHHLPCGAETFHNEPHECELEDGDEEDDEDDLSERASASTLETAAPPPDPAERNPAT